MKNSEVVQAILNYHPEIKDYQGCDEWKAGDPQAECTGVAVALVPCVDVIKKAAALGCNLLIAHETIYYQTPDYREWRGSFINTVQKEKEQLLDQTKMAVWRDHDHMHRHHPDSIFWGVIKYLGWEAYYKPIKDDIQPFYYAFEIPETSVGALAKELTEKIGMNGIRYMGNADDKISRVAIVAHIYPNSFFVDGIKEDGYYHSYDMTLMERMEKDGIQAIIPGEIIEWTILSYIRDGIDLKKPVACFNIGHYNWEELGMRYAGDWLREILPKELPVHYIPTTDHWNYLVNTEKHR